MNRYSLRFIVYCFLFTAFCFSLSAQDDNTERLWYNKPASIWLEALPIGNSRLGGMVYGGTTTAQLQLNEETFWSGGPHNNNSKTSINYLDQVRNLIFNRLQMDAKISDADLQRVRRRRLRFACLDVSARNQGIGPETDVSLH